MKNILLLLAISTISIFAFAQGLPTEKAEGFAFPIGSKFTIKLHTTDSNTFDISIIKFEYFKEITDRWETDSLFDEEGEKGTIDFYFCLATHGDTEKEKKENMEVVLRMKNRTKYALKYDSDISREEGDVFEKTSNIGTFPGVLGNESWPYMIYQIKLKNFRVMEY